MELIQNFLIVQSLRATGQGLREFKVLECRTPSRHISTLKVGRRHFIRDLLFAFGALGRRITFHLGRSGVIPLLGNYVSHRVYWCDLKLLDLVLSLDWSLSRNIIYMNVLRNLYLDRRGGVSAITSTDADSVVGGKMSAASMFISALGAGSFFLCFEEPLATLVISDMVTAFSLFDTIVCLKLLRFNHSGALTLDDVSIVEPTTDLGNTRLISTTDGTNI